MAPVRAILTCFWVTGKAGSHGDRVGKKWHDALGFLSGQGEAEAAVKVEMHLTAIQWGSPKVRHLTTVHDNVVMLKWAGEVDAEALLQRVAVVVLRH